MTLLKQIDGIGTCGVICPSADSPSAGTYCAPYVGERFEESRVMFIGLDAGNTDSPDAVSRRKEVVTSYRSAFSKDWNPHYRGCIWVASHLLKSPCLECTDRCLKKPDSECVLLQIAQTNAVRCVVDQTQENMAFRGQDRISSCIPLAFRDMDILDPGVVILQGKNRDSGHLHETFAKEAERQHGQWEQRISYEEHFGILNWHNRRILVGSFHHPSHGWLKRDWEKVIQPTLEKIRAKRCEMIP